MATEKIDGRRSCLWSVTPVASTNATLWLDRFLKRGSGDAPIRTLIVEALDRIKAPEGYPRAYARREAALASLDAGFEAGVTRFWTGEVQGRMIVGIGTASVRETGISLLRMWGVPFIPGSALKGVAASMARRQVDEAWKPGGAGHRGLFGDHLHGGSVVFHDAWWVPAAPGEPLPLDLDVMTVHHHGYYSGDGPPCDWDEPNPVAFITARGCYLVALSGPSSWVEAAGTLLAVGLEELGIGAKTAAGYGRVKLERKPTQMEAEQARRHEERAKRAAPLRNLTTRFKGASNANDLVNELLKAQRDGVDPTDVRAAAASLWGRDPKFWKEWSKKPARTPDERALMAPPAERDGQKPP